MKMGPKGLALLKRWEGLRTTAYLCPAGKWTIGYGHTSAAGHPVVTKGMKISAREAEEILMRDLGKYEADVTRLVKVPLTQEQFDALVSFHYNTGKLGTSTLLKKLNAKKYAEVPAELQKWVVAGGKRLKGLIDRRADEAALWLSKPDAPAPVTDPQYPQPAPLPVPTPPAKPAPEAAKPSGLWARVAWLIRGKF
jgi:lysozyme